MSAIVLSDSAVADSFYYFLDFFWWKYKSETHISFSMRTKTCSRSYNNTGFFHKFHAECHTVSTSSRDFGPYKHSSLPIGEIPANASESLAERISSFLIHLALFLYTFQWTPQSCNGCFLNRKEHTEVNLASQLAKCCDHIRTAYQKTDTCTGYIERFGQAEKFYAYFSGS